MPNPHDEWKEFHEELFERGQDAVGRDIAHQDAKRRVEQTQEILRMASDTIDIANEIAKDGDPHKQLLANLIKDKVAGVAKEVADGAAGRAAEGRGALEASPLSESSGNSEMSLDGSTAKVLAHEASEPSKRKRGRPPKHSAKG
jgi:hypothetical protein